jgi:hypothetical protein
LNVKVAINVGRLDSGIAITRATGAPLQVKRTLHVFGVTAGVDIPFSPRFSAGYKISAVHFDGDTDLRFMLGLRLHFEDWDGPPD